MELKGDHTVIDLGSIDTKSVVNLQVKDIRYVNSLSSREMESLVAICDTFLPSVNITSGDRHFDSVAGAREAFYLSSASMAGTPQRVGGLICERLEHSKKWLIRLTLWMLSTRIGTFILCGWPSVSVRFPYFNSFGEISEKNREHIFLSWSLSFFYLLRMFFKAMKLLTLFVFFSQVDEKNENLVWKAIDYPGPDPEMKKLRLNKLEAENDRAKINGPLQDGLIHMNLPRDIVADSLQKSGLSISITRPSKKDSPSLRIRCDAVVVGSGSGGGVVAGVLAKAGYKVLILEKGNYHARTNLSLLEGPTMDQMYQSGGLLATEDLGVVILAGSTVGGGSTINWSASIRTPQHVIDEWSEVRELELFKSKLYREALDVVCEKMGVQSEINEEGFNNAILRKGCKELGYPINTIPRNSAADHYCGWCCLGCKDGKKKGNCETWLLDFVNSGNGVILPGCEAIEILRKPQGKGCRKASASGVAFEFEYCKGVKELCVVESKVTVVACGALNTPLLLKRSGLKNSNIGKHLHLHPVAMAWGHFPETTWPQQEKKSYKGGIMTAMSTVVADFDDSGYGAVIQTPSLHPGMFSSLQPWLSGIDIKLRMSRFSRTAHVFALARDKGSGTINSKTSITYKLDSSDEKNLQIGIEKILRILTAAGAEEIGTHHCKGRTLNVKRASCEEFERFVKEESERPLRDLTGQICSAHQMGSCRMGVHPNESVVDERGETWEMEGLFVADTSVFPTALGVNPMVTVQAIAYCTAQSVLDTLKRGRT